MSPLVELSGINKVFRRPGQVPIHALNDISLTMNEGETLALIGESGSGKSTLGRIVLRLLEADSGTVRFEGVDLSTLPHRRMRNLRSRLQVVFQEPYEALDPRLSVGNIIAEPLRVHEPGLSSAELRERVLTCVEQVGLPPDAASRKPGMLSGGQQQRVGIARAIITRPQLIVLDEPTSSLDLSVRAHVLELLAELQRDLNLTYLFISHDIHTVEYVSSRIAVMYLGRIVETGTVREVFDDPRHPYTRALLSARLSTDPRESVPQLRLTGDIGAPTEAHQGCVLAGRCPLVIDECTAGPIQPRALSDDHEVACIRAEETPDLLASTDR